MIDINFYMKMYELKQKIMMGEVLDKKFVSDEFEKNRNKNPIIYNIETTNACNMKCKMCPRTTMMTRPVENIEKETFIKIVDQINPFSKEQWNSWENFVEKKYGISRNDMSENHFFLYIIPKVIQLHGYGDPLLDKNMAYYIKTLNEKGFFSYFSCNPVNIDVEKTVQMFKNGLDYIKYSIETVDDMIHKQIRGEASNFSTGYKKIMQLLEIKKKEKYKTVIIITMLDLNRSNQKEDFLNLKKAFEEADVYIYLKSEDTQWYRKDYHPTCSVHWTEFCQHPWASMTIKSNGEVAMCMEDFNNEIILGDAKKETLYDIWNGEKYIKFRRDHFNVTRGIRCTERCDMKLIGSFFCSK
ncbi:MAG: SPASM domain-containing protein [Elusimicrobiota bacterium]